MTPLVLLHGFTGTPQAFDAVLGHLDRPGHTPALLGHTPEAPATDWDGELDRLDRILGPVGEPVHLVGYSLGARVSLGLATSRPERVARLTLIGVNPGLSDADRPPRQAWEDGLARMLETEGIAAFVDHWERLPLWATQARLPSATLARQRAARLSHDPRGLARSLRTCGLGRMPDLRPALPDLRVPVDLVVGAEDAKFRAIAQEMTAALQHAQVHLVPDCGHNVVLEAPAALARILGQAG